jgi:hypothetical protein
MKMPFHSQINGFEAKLIQVAVQPQRDGNYRFDGRMVLYSECHFEI